MLSGDKGNGKEAGGNNGLVAAEFETLGDVTLSGTFDWETEPFGEELERAE